MKPHNDLENQIKRLRFQPSAAADKRILTDGHAARAVRDDAAQSSPPAISPTLWKTLLKSKLTRFATAAALILAVALPLYLQNGSIDVATLALAQVTENMKKMPWLHQVSKGLERGIEGSGEQWISFEPKIFISKNADGSVQYNNYQEHEQHNYDPITQTITISYLRDEGLPLDLSSPASVLESMIETLTEQGAKISQETGEYNGKKVVIQQLSLTKSGFDTKVRLFVDAQGHLMIAAHIQGVDAEGTVVMEGDISYDYPVMDPRASAILVLPHRRQSQIISPRLTYSRF